VTIQLKNITKGEGTATHQDKNNCKWAGYTKTSTACFTFQDAYGNIWSLKFVCNSRANAGKFFDVILELKPMMTRIKRQMEMVDHTYMDLACIQRDQGGHQYPDGLTAKTFPNLVLDESIPWETVDIGCGIMMHQYKLPALFVHDLHLSSAASVVHSFAKSSNDLCKTIELSIAAGYVPGFHRFHYVGTEHSDELISSWHPFLEYCRLANGLFGDVPLGDTHVGRVSPSSVDIGSVYNSDRGATLACVVDGILSILYWINDTISTDDFNHSNIEKCFQLCQ